MTSIVFESATIIDVVKKAARVAPGKGHAFDKANGIIVQVTPNEEVKCLIRATNLDVFYSEVVGCVESEGDDVVWRLPSQLLAAVLGKLPIGSGKQIKFSQDGNKVNVTSGRLRVIMNLADATYYPEWDMFDGSSLSTVSGLGGRLSLVEWAADSGAQPPYNAVYMDGEYLVATDRYKVARVPMKVDLPHPVVVPAGLLGASLKSMGDTALGVSGTMLHLMPDDFTQIQTVIFDVQYPPVSSVMRTDYPVKVEVPKVQLIDMLDRANQFASADRSPLLRMYFGKSEIAAMMANDEIGLIGDAIEVPGQIPHRRCEIKFTPKYIIDAISKSPNDKVTLMYDPENANRTVYVDGGSGYECWVLPRRDITPQP